MKSLKDILIPEGISNSLIPEGILDDPDIVMDKMNKSAIATEYNKWIRRCSFSTVRPITENNVQFINGVPVIEHSSTIIDIRELPPFKVVLPNVNNIRVSVGTNRFTKKAGVTLEQQMKVLREIIEESGGWEISEFLVKNETDGEKVIDYNFFCALGSISIKNATLYTGEAQVKLPYIWDCRNVEIHYKGNGDIIMNGVPAGVTKINISKN